MNKTNNNIARVTAVHKDSYIISNDKGNIFAELTGKMLYSADSPLELPTVGDYVESSFYDGNELAIINNVVERKTLLKRKTAGKRVDFQLIAANIDTAFIMQSLNGNFNTNRLERYLVMAKDSNIEPVVLLSKSDLLSQAEIDDRVAEIKRVMPELKVQPFSNNGDLSGVRALLESGKTYCLLGSSGVGKTTLLNNLTGSQFATKEVRAKDDRGRHATTTKQLMTLENGAMIIDTAGMRELGSIEADTGINETFNDVIELIGQCRYSNCTHANEKGCAIRKAIKKGKLEEKRFQNYLKVKRESEFNKMSYLEKKHRGKDFSKHVKSVLKGNKKYK